MTFAPSGMRRRPLSGAASAFVRALLFAAAILAPPSRDGNNGRLGRLALAAHSAPGNAAGFGGDTGTVPELDAFRTTGSGASASPTIVSQFTDQHGLVAIGMVAELLDELNRAFCDQTLTRVYKCAAYEDARRRLWMTFADDYICGVDHDQWSSGARVADLPIQEQFEYLLSQCHAPWDGDLVAVVREATVLFLAQSTLNRPDIKAVVMANDAKAGRADTLPTDDLYALHPGFYEDIAPATTLRREPAVATWRVEVDLDGHTPYAEGGVPRQAALDAREGILLAEEGATEQYPEEFDAKLSRGAPGLALYRANYQTHPSPLARWDDEYCGTRTLDDELCYPRVEAMIGVTHDARGRRLLTNQGLPLPEGYGDPNALAADRTTSGGRRR